MLGPDEERERGGMGCRSHAVTEAGLWRLAVAWCCCVAVAVRLLRRHGHVGPRCEHELWCSYNTNIIGDSHKHFTGLPPHIPGDVTSFTGLKSPFLP